MCASKIHIKFSMHFYIQGFVVTHAVHVRSFTQLQCINCYPKPSGWNSLKITLSHYVRCVRVTDFAFDIKNTHKVQYALLHSGLCCNTCSACT